MTTTRMIGKTFGLVAAMCFLSVSAYAQDDDEGPITQGEDAKYLSITHVAFKPGQREAAMEIITEHFVAAGEKAGTPRTDNGDSLSDRQMGCDLHLGDGRGMADLEWYRSPDNVKWFAALAELSGGADKAEEIWASYVSKIAEAVTEVGHHHVAEAE